MINLSKLDFILIIVIIAMVLIGLSGYACYYKFKKTDTRVIYN